MTPEPHEGPIPYSCAAEEGSAGATKEATLKYSVLITTMGSAELKSAVLALVKLL